MVINLSFDKLEKKIKKELAEIDKKFLTLEKGLEQSVQSKKELEKFKKLLLSTASDVIKERFDEMEARLIKKASKDLNERMIKKAFENLMKKNKMLDDMDNRIDILETTLKEKTTLLSNISKSIERKNMQMTSAHAAKLRENLKISKKILNDELKGFEKKIDKNLKNVDNTLKDVKDVKKMDIVKLINSVKSDLKHVSRERREQSAIIMDLVSTIQEIREDINTLRNDLRREFNSQFNSLRKGQNIRIIRLQKASEKKPKVKTSLIKKKAVKKTKKRKK